MIMPYTIRSYSVDDLISVLDIWEIASRQVHPFLSDEDIADQRRQVEEIYLPNTETWVVEADGGVVGFIGLIVSENPSVTVMVGGLFLLPAFHGKGLGRALMDKAVENHGNLDVEVFEINTLGRQFYQRYGFVPVSESIHEQTGQPLLHLHYMHKHTHDTTDK